MIVTDVSPKLLCGPDWGELSYTWKQGHLISIHWVFSQERFLYRISTNPRVTNQHSNSSIFPDVHKAGKTRRGGRRASMIFTREPACAAA